MEYLSEIRKEACSRCTERAPGGPPVGPGGKYCGGEQNLPQLIEAVHEVHSRWMGPYCESTESHVCTACSARHTDSCPCPMDSLLLLVVQAVEAVDARHEQRADGLRRAAELPGRDRPGMEGVLRAFEEAVGVWTGCDWPTRFGRNGLDLNGWTAEEAEAAAEERRGVADEQQWRAAAWLRRLEHFARRAEEEGGRAVYSASAGARRDALEHARRAREIEFATGRSVWRGTPMTWQPLLRAVFAASPDHPAEAAAEARTELPMTTPV